jgi:predicted porin
MTCRSIGSVLAAACALASGTASAQSNVTISGMIDIGVYRDAASKWNVGSIQRSNLAFSGSEDLGGGLRATFKLSHRFDPDVGQPEGTPNKPFWHGESTVGLKGAFGAIRLGRALDAIYANDWNYDPWWNFNRVASPAWDLWHYNYPSDPRANNGQADYGRLNNGVFYDSPSFAGLSVHLSTSPEKRPGDLRRPAAGSLTYEQGPIAAMLGYGKNSAGQTDAFVALRGTLDALALMGAYNVSEDGPSEAKTVTLGAQYTLGQFTLNAGWGQVDVDGVKAQRMAAAGAVYALSKRTSVYADVAHKRFPTQNRTLYGAGVAHSF